MMASHGVTLTVCVQRWRLVVAIAVVRLAIVLAWCGLWRLGVCLAERAADFATRRLEVRP